MFQGSTREIVGALKLANKPDWLYSQIVKYLFEDHQGDMGVGCPESDCTDRQRYRRAVWLRSLV
jgi:hypothetical protein